jgi:TonB family protein
MPTAAPNVAALSELAPSPSPVAAEPDAAPAAAALAPPPAPALPARPAAAAPAEAASPWSDDDTYLPRQALTDVPQAAGPVLLDYPAEAPAGRWRATLTLFIDSDGQVRRVRIDDGALPAVLQAQAREAFLAARFSPGRIDGRAVRARLRVEVEFAADTAREMGVPRPVP